MNPFLQADLTGCAPAPTEKRFLVSRPVGLVMAMAALLVLPANAPAQSGMWTNTNSGNWSDTNNWSGGIVADGADNGADFSAIDITADVTNHLDSARTIGNLTFGDTDANTAAGWTLDNGGSETNVLTLAAGAPAITVSNSVTISAPLGLVTANYQVAVAAGGTLALGGKITTSGASGSTTVLSKTGPGVLNITGQFFDDFATQAPGVKRQNPIEEGVVNLTNATVYSTKMWVNNTAHDTFVSATNSTITLDGTVDRGNLSIGNANKLSSYAMHGGSLTIQNWGGINLGYFGSGAEAIMTIDHNAQVAINNGSWFWLGDNSAASGMVVMRDGSLSVDGTSQFWVGVASGMDIFTQLGGTVNSAVPVNLKYRMNRSTCFGIYNLNGGTLTAAAITSGDGTPNFTGNKAYFNFHGGILRPTGDSVDFIFSTLTGGKASVSAPQAIVYSEGAVIDTTGFNITINEPLVAPAGQGVASGPSGIITIPDADKGAGYRGTPVVYVKNAVDDTNGVGATAVANMVDDDSGKGTFKIDSITITNPGINYTLTPTLTITDGAPTTPAVLPALGIVTNVSGGLTKLGAGTLTLTAANTYTGDTIVNAGTLELTQACLADQADVRLAGDGRLAVSFDGEDRIRGLYYDGVAQPRGVYYSGALGGAIGGSGSGYLKVAEAPSAPGLRVIVR